MVYSQLIKENLYPSSVTQHTHMTGYAQKTREKEIIAEFNALPDVDAKYAHLFQLAESLPKMAPELKTDANLVKDCQSALWCCLEWRDGGVHLSADSESLVMKGIAALLMRIVEGCQLEDIKHLNLDVIDRLQIWKLASERNSSLKALLKHIKTQARDLQHRSAAERNESDPCQD